MPFPGMPELDENDPLYEFFRRFLPPQQRPQPQPERRRGEPGQAVPRGVGSGFVISADGFIMTNAHVIQGADEVFVTLTDKREFKARVVGSDQRTDVAVVKIEASNLPRVAIGDVNELKVGQWVVAIGSPFGLENTVTAGIVSAKQRDTGEFLPFIQTDVAVNPGNSGGPLLNMRGEVVGINSMIYSRTGGFMGISFAIPIDEAMRIADQLRSSGRVTRGRIGVGIAEVSKEVAESLGVKPVGALVRNVEKSTDLPRLVAATRPGSRVTLQVWRKGQLRDLTVVVAEMPAEQRAQASKPATPASAEPNALGLVTSDLTDTQKRELRIKGGVMVEAVDGAAARAGLRQGDVILSLNNTDLNSSKQFNDLVAKLDRNKAAVLLVRRGDSASFVPVRPAAR
jgi:serine protease Do